MKYLPYSIRKWLEIVGIYGIPVGAGLLCTLIALAIFLLASRMCSKENSLSSKLFWKLSLIWMFVTALLTAVPRDYWINPPGSGIVALPRGANVVAVWGFRGNFDSYPQALQRTPFCAETSANIGYPWFWRRNLSGLIGQDFGDRIPEIERQCECGDWPGIASACAFENRGRKEAILVFDIKGGSSLPGGVWCSYFREQSGVWKLVSKESNSFDEFLEFMPYFVARFVGGPYGVGAIVLLILLVLKYSGLRPGHHRSLSMREPLLMLPSVFLLYAANFAWAIVVTYLEAQMQINHSVVDPALVIMAMLITFAYLAYRLALDSERRQRGVM